MKLFLIFQDANSNYDTFDSAVVVAESAVAAGLIHPYGNMEWNGKSWRRPGSDWDDSTWAPPESVGVTEIGTANEGVAGVVCSSFNAG